MKNKILGLPKAAVIVIGIVITALFLVLMNLVGGVVAHLTSIADSYTLQSVCCFLWDISSRLRKPVWDF